MQLSAPIYRLKRQARILSREKDIPLHAALDEVAAAEGFGTWSLLAVKASATAPARKIFARLLPGDLVLIGARPGQGKTLMSLELAVAAMRAGHRAMFFTLDLTERDMAECFRSIGEERAQFEALFLSDHSDAISADYIVRKLSSAPRRTLAVIDYLQLLDQRRENPDLIVQVQTLKSFAQARGLIFVFSSQIDRSYDASV